jgi:hypothetical protein
MSTHKTGTPKAAIQAAFLPYPHATSTIAPIEFKAISSANFAKIFDGARSIGFLWVIFLSFLIKTVPRCFSLDVVMMFPSQNYNTYSYRVK